MTTRYRQRKGFNPAAIVLVSLFCAITKNKYEGAVRV